MTLIVGIKCSDGIVMAADGAATLTQMGQHTALQPAKKLNVLAGKIIVAVSGSVGLAQRITGEIEQLWCNRGLVNQTPFQAMTTMRQLFWNHVGMELRAATEASRIIGNVAAQGAICTTVVALPVGGLPCLFQFDQQCAPEEATDQLPFISTGSAQSMADPFLAFLRRIFWERQPTLSDGLFAAVWTLEHAIKTSPGGVADPIQLATLKRAGQDCEAREYSNEELDEHRQAAAAAESHLARFKEELQAPEEGRAPEEKPPEPRK